MQDDLHKLRIDKAHKARREERAVWPWVLIVALGLLGAAGLWQWRVVSAATVVQTVRVPAPEISATTGPSSSSSSDLADDTVVLNAAGYVMAAHKIELASKVVGRVAWIGVEMGDKVTKGQVLARLEDDEYKARVAQQKGQVEAARAKLAELEAGSRVEEVASAKAQVDKAAAELAIAEVSHTRLSESPKGTVSPQEVDDAGALVEARKAQLDWQRQQYELVKNGPRKEQVEAQRATVRQLEGALAMSEIELDNTVIRAPLDATVLERNVELGEFITTGFVGEGGAKGFIVSLADLNELRVELDISQNDFSKVAAKQPCLIVTDAYPDKKYHGFVDLISPEANRQKATIEVRVKVTDPDERLKPDMNATVSFLAPKSGSTTGAVEAEANAAPARRGVPVPASAVRDGAVFVVENGKAVKREVVVRKGTVGNGQSVEVREGLIGGEDLIVSPPPTLQDGASVRMIESKS